jgi:hypothetical protein
MLMKGATAVGLAAHSKVAFLLVFCGGPAVTLLSRLSFRR